MMSIRGRKAADFFRQGYNCAQAVVLAFGDELKLDQQTLAKLASSFGGGMGRLREVCGAVSGMFLMYGLLEGYDNPADYEGKKEQYRAVQEMAEVFKEKHGSITCSDILKKPSGPEDYRPEERTELYYESRPCEQCVYDAAEILEIFLRK